MSYKNCLAINHAKCFNEHTKLTLVKMLLINFNKQSEFSFKVIQTEYDKTLVMIKNDHEFFENSTNC